jgi:hypothetical protein
MHSTPQPWTKTRSSLASACLLSLLCCQAFCAAPALPGEPPGPEYSELSAQALPGETRFLPQPAETAAESPVAAGPAIEGLAPPAPNAPLEPKSAAASLSAESEPFETSGRPLRIGYLPRPAEGGIDEPLARALGKHLSDHAGLGAALAHKGYSGEVIVQAADGFNDLTTRLNLGLFDAAFCPAAVYASLSRADGSPGAGYRVILKEDHDSESGSVIFVGPSSNLFGAENFTPEELQEALRTEELAVPSAYDAAGFHYPCLALVIDQNVNLTGLRYRFCGSSREVVKHVVSGLASIGACDKAALDVWVKEVSDVPEDKMLRRLAMPTLNAPRIPADPVIVCSELDTQYSEAGRKLKEAMQGFFDSREDAPFRLKPVMEADYKKLREDLAFLRYLREGGQLR